MEIFENDFEVFEVFEEYEVLETPPQKSYTANGFDASGDICTSQESFGVVRKLLDTIKQLEDKYSSDINPKVWKHFVWEHLGNEDVLDMFVDEIYQQYKDYEKNNLDLVRD